MTGVRFHLPLRCLPWPGIDVGSPGSERSASNSTTLPLPVLTRARVHALFQYEGQLI